jgi:serine/threonine-protein kinase HipA
LPEGPLRRRLAATRKSQRDMDNFGILAAAGEDLPGAIRVVPANLDNLTPAVRALGATGGADNLEICVPEEAASLSGVQDKMALSLANAGKRYCMPVKGVLSDMIAKLPAPRDDSQVMNEFACMQLAELAGVVTARCLPVPMREMSDHAELVEALGAKTHFLAVERFDRRSGRAVHMEDACQLLTLMPTQKYAATEHFVNFLQVLNRFSVRGIEDVRQFFVRQAVNALIGNSDAHLKNFSVMYNDGRRPELSPAYDIVCVAVHQRNETVKKYAEVAKQAGVSARIAMAAVAQTVARARELWPAALKDMHVPVAVREEITNRLNTLPLAAI